RSRSSQLNVGNEQEILLQNRYLYLLVKELRCDVKEIKDELKWQRKERENDLSPRILDI
ncbi:2222_t:CDS:1, partial [Gigaspora rosea]